MRLKLCNHRVIIFLVLILSAAYSQEHVTKMRISAILVKDIHKAKEIVKSLQDGANFSELANQHSVGPYKEKGGLSPRISPDGKYLFYVNGGMWWRPAGFIEELMPKELKNEE